MNEKLLNDLKKCEDSAIDALFVMTSHSQEEWKEERILSHIVDAGNHLIFAVERIKAAKRILNGELQ
jgi:hypothetical protein